MIVTETNKPDTVEDGKRKWMYPLVRKGKLYQYRSWLSYLYLLLFFATPYLRINGNPVLLLNILERRFVILGKVFWPQDFFLFVLVMLAGIVCVVLFTMAFGRFFCGWICPQTIFMEMFFRKIEAWIEGDARQRKKLDAAPWTTNKIIRKTSKHVIFIVLSFVIANTFLSYIIGSEGLWKIITEPISQHWSGFISICLFTAVFYFIYSQVREIVCTVICPYGRLQGVLTDKHTLSVAYNYQRGEPRGKLNRKSEEQKGDCVDCKLCVDVCPTGIDIRKGPQLECINCTACIDACNEVMLKINKQANLIGFYSEEMIEKKTKPAFTARMATCSLVMVTLLGALTWFVGRQSDIDVTVLRSAGLLYQEQPGGYISNIYNADLINKTNKAQNITLVADDPSIKIKYIQAPGVIGSNQATKATFFLLVPANHITAAKTDINLKIIQGKTVVGTTSTTFVGPVD
ncbi:cytochrome c oxidase accessory protein CcoG [Mucilaginibacter robiniae]|uniref:Cytochrome c oxidase accessory protein CcoG n=1 Tax=Mucilaginibacter robiniae TaxID=2728022 RepID=A0A7L5E7C4_9SPHI|nr:cytochrome c oxidase accessory protein CcoG [Mucilaginibacter robiniae]QJD98209.1 cytochrome c oxidase accessory protein CcoG [Mucilaginibacter robiniae]